MNAYKKTIQSFSEKELFRFVQKGILIEKMKKSDNFLSDSHTKERLEKYKICIGTVAKYSLFKKKIKSVYVIYEDFDGSIKYYDYPQ
ncbi:hypothetical protein ACOJIU_18515 (plasmid) [Carnobacterium maltaromaticum]|uniref:hypothetical protein n=1 Tax=Carnobacterium maltaromaticum TaxID=2751 RepID=UPI003450C368